MGLEIWNRGCSDGSDVGFLACDGSAEGSIEGKVSLYEGDTTPVLVMVHFRFLEASHRTALLLEPLP